MGSPFPGMDPYLESPNHWSDFHYRFIDDLCDAISEKLPGDYFARLGEYVMLVTPEMGRGKSVGPDVLVGGERQRTAAGGGAATAAPGAAVELEPTTLANVEQIDPYTEGYIEIVHLPDREVVTVVELLSPTNKYGDGRGLYLEKRRSLMRQAVNVVELDLLRAGRRFQLSKPLPKGDYYLFVSRGDRRPECDVYAWTVRQKLPLVPIPLRAPDADVKIHLQEVFDATYDRARYSKMIDYRTQPDPPFREADAEWVATTAGTGTAGR